MNHITVIGMDISKHVFHIVGLDARRRIVIGDGN